MRLSCNGCRVLRKGCSENCSIRPCLQWIKSPESQANATLFLAKFYGRAGLINLINAGPQHLRPAIFRSLLYEACGRIVNPVYGSVGLLWSGSWQLCQAAVEAVLMGTPITPITSEAAASSEGPPLKAHDIRHVSKDENLATSNGPKKVAKTRSRFKRSKLKSKKASTGSDGGSLCCTASAAGEVVKRAGSHESSLSHESDAPKAAEVESKENESMISGETAGTSMLLRDEPESMAEPCERADDGSSDVGLELTLGFEPVSIVNHVIPVKKRRLAFDFELKS